MLDYLDQEIRVNDTIVFIAGTTNGSKWLLKGQVQKLTEKSLVVLDEKGETRRLSFSNSPYRNNNKMIKAVVLKEKPMREGEVKDIAGYPIHVGDDVLIMESHSFGTSFFKAKVTKVSPKVLHVEGDTGWGREHRRAPDRVVVV